MPPICVIPDHPSHVIRAGRFEKPVKDLLCREGRGGASVNIILSGDRRLRELNKKFRKKDRSTDVLSFSFDEKQFLGEIYISLDKAKNQAAEFGATFENEIWRLMVHGLFHLIGHTHYKRKERLRMEKKESLYIGII
jgi:probable rRNA maturation factor